MRKIICLLFFIVGLAGFVSAQKGGEIIKQEQFFYDSLKEKNMKILPKLFHKDFHGIHSGGYIDRKTEVEGFQYAILEEYRFSNILVKFPAKNVGVIAYRAYIKGSYKGKDVTGNSYHTSTWVKKGKNWKMILHTEVPEAKTEDKRKMDKDFKAIATNVYKVSDLEKGKAWYTKAFGIKPYFDEPFYVGFNVSGYELGLLPEEEKKSVKGDGSISYWLVDDIEGMYKRFIDAGATDHEKPNSVGGELMVGSVKDPWGNIIGLIYNPVFKK